MMIIHIFTGTLQSDDVTEEFGDGAVLQGSKVQRSRCFHVGMRCYKIKF